MAKRILVPVALLLALGACRGGMMATLGTGDYWYRMLDAEGAPQGYAHMVIGVAEGSGRHVDWELKIAFSGGSYEEYRSITFDPEGNVLAARYTPGEKTVADLSRSGDEWVARNEKGEKKVVDAPADAVTGMGFVLAAVLPQEAGAVHERIELNEAKGFESLGTTVFTWRERVGLAWQGGEIDVHRYEMRRGDGTVLPVWVDEQRRIVQVDWGGGNLMVLSSQSTKHLFRPAPPAVTVVETGPETLVVTGVFPRPPEEVFDSFTVPERLAAWWAPKAEIDLEPGGRFHLSWPEANWVMRGTVREFERGRLFVFTWKWDHEADGGGEVERVVRVELGPEGEGEGATKLTLTHGPYTTDAKDQEARTGHLEGWRHFLTRLKAEYGT